MTWTLIESATEADASLELYAKDGMFMIRANGFELMNGFCHDSEIALGLLAANLAPPRDSRILIGGLGLGYTVAALVGAVGAGAQITVAELSAAVIDWFHRYLKASLLPHGCNTLTIVHTDVADLLKAKRGYDVIVLDIDNGPEPLVTAGNGALYSAEGLRSLHAGLSAEGRVLLWSGFQSAAFETAARQAGFTLTCEPFRRARPELSHYVYVLSKDQASQPRS